MFYLGSKKFFMHVICTAKHSFRKVWAFWGPQKDVSLVIDMKRYQKNSLFGIKKKFYLGSKIFLFGIKKNSYLGSKKFFLGFAIGKIQ